MIQIDDVVVSLDFFREKFCCDLTACKGCCCIEGDAGAPLQEEEIPALEEVLPLIEEQLSPAAREIIARQGVCYIDEEGDLVTSIVNGKDCVFTCYDEKGCCFCAIERAYLDGKTLFANPFPATSIQLDSKNTPNSGLLITTGGRFVKKQSLWEKKKMYPFIAF